MRGILDATPDVGMCLLGADGQKAFTLAETD